jgi:Alcohol dehydrogenase GroES-associated/Alcohol dehydrogenase GroES-like domain
MKAVTWHGKRDVRVDKVPDPTIQEPTDAIVKITTTAICGSDLHLYEVLGPFMGEGDILGHEPMGVVEEVGAEVDAAPARRSCGDALPDRLRQVLHVRTGLADPVRDDPGARARDGGRALRLHQALRRGPRRPGRVPARAAGAVRADQSAGGTARRALPLSLRRAADRLAGGRVRRRAEGRQPRRPRARPDRRHVLSGRTGDRC